MPSFRRLRYLLAVVILLAAAPGRAETVRIAVASNFSPTLKVLAKLFESQTDYSVTISAASSGKHYLQIVNGAPFDIFLSADDERPMLLEQSGIAKPDSRLTYAVGRLVLWAGSENRLELDGQSINAESISAHPTMRIAIANPRLAPYGVAAQQVISALGISSLVNSRLVRGENINQAFQYVATGNASFGFVAYSQLLNYDQFNHDELNYSTELGHSLSQQFWIVPQSMYSPILQDAVRLSDSSAAIAFMVFLGSESARKIISDRGYNNKHNADQITSSTKEEAK